MSLLDAVKDKRFKAFAFDADDSVAVSWDHRYSIRMTRHDAIKHFGTVGMMQLLFAKTMQINAGRLEHEGISRALFEVSYDHCKDEPYDTNTPAKFKIIKDSININQLDAVLKRTSSHENNKK